ncbi:hypothetical protein CQA53_08680 [Helicobacter didelphidarum]|uniref:Uncharacterized protein n=1 Tax=Helicobacter didelphidarum TaxID=2040648 RepID=A0A3D8IDI5_9HELI|nr:hypothetical protein [Helicobacter didelphidarum]RDU63209.1 hypothetical protein CQA53_08680 [Helicobacter didelphidarum]
MEVAITIKNADKNMIKAIKAILQTQPSLDFRIDTIEPKLSKRTIKAIKAVECGDVIRCKDFEDFKKKVLE